MIDDSLFSIRNILPVYFNLLKMDVELLSNNNHEKKITPSPNIEFSIKLDQSIKHIIKSEGFIKYEINKRCVSTNGGNYLGTLYEIDVKGRTKDGDKEMHIFAKHAVDIGFLQIISIVDVYSSEMFAYKELSKIFTELQENANVPREEMYKMAKAYEETNTETIIMENLTRCGFTTYHRMDIPPLKFFERSVIHLAKFHALSFVLGEKRPEYFNKKIKPIKYPVIFGNDWAMMIKTIKDAVIERVDEDLKVTFEKCYDNFADKYAQYQNDESIKACLCHGDYRPNNIMVKLNEGEVQEIMPIDYQLIHYGCPVFDLLYLIFISTDRDFRKAHMLNLKDLYYDTLKSFMKYFGLDADVVYPRKEFENVYEERLDYGLILGLTALTFIFVSENNIPDVSKDASMLSFQFDDRIDDRLRGLIEDFVEWGFI